MVGTGNPNTVPTGALHALADPRRCSYVRPGNTYPCGNDARPGTPYCGRHSDAADPAPRMAEAEAGHPAPRRQGYYLEAWDGPNSLDCVAWAYVRTPGQVARKADAWAQAGSPGLRIYVRWTGDKRGLAADWTWGHGWTCPDDAALQRALGVTR